MSDDNVIPIALVAHHVFCPRRAWLEAHGEKADTAPMAEGTAAHTAVDDPSRSRGSRLTAVHLRSERLGLTGRADAVEVAPDRSVTLIEHKATPLRRKLQVSARTRVQLALEALCLREMGWQVKGAAVWNATLRRRIDVPLDEELERLAIEHVHACREVFRRGTPPPPLEDDPRCSRCSHVSICLPDEHRSRVPARQISVSDPAARVLHISTAGSRARLRRGRIEISAPDRDEPIRVPIEQVAGIIVQGNADLSSAVIRETLSRGYPLVWCSWTGRVVGWASPAGGPNGDVRRAQYGLSEDRRIAVARRIVAGKIANQASFLRRHGASEREKLLALADAARSAPTIESALGIEGRAAVAYFRALGRAVRAPWMSFERRQARPAPDEANAALNLVYALLLADALRALIACGLDPAAGILHSSVQNKPALALDLMEEFRPILADSAFMWAINNGELRQSNFRSDLGAVRLTDRGRRALIAAYERRMQTEFKHPRFGYRVSWRRALEVHARLLLAFFRGELDSYHPIVVR